MLDGRIGKKRQNKGYGYFTVNAYIVTIADDKHISNIYKEERLLLGVHK